MLIITHEIAKRKVTRINVFRTYCLNTLSRRACLKGTWNTRRQKRTTHPQRVVVYAARDFCRRLSRIHQVSPGYRIISCHSYKRDSHDVRPRVSKTYKINPIVPPVGFLREAGASAKFRATENLPFPPSHKGFSCIIFAGARRNVPSSDGGSTRPRIKGERNTYIYI